jgi:hypothetical protein
LLIEQLKLDKELLTKKIESLETIYEEQLRNIRQENYTLQAKVYLEILMFKFISKQIFR